MTDIQDRLATGKGKFTPLYPDLGTGPVSYEDSISPEFFDGRARGGVQAVVAVRRPRSSGCRGRARTSPASCPGGSRRSSSPAASTASVHAFHNVCAHRGNKVVWQEHPQRGDERLLPAVRLQVPRLALRPRRVRHARHQRAGVLRPRQGLARHAEGALRGVRRVHLRQPVAGPGAAARPSSATGSSSSRPTRSSG